MRSCLDKWGHYTKPYADVSTDVITASCGISKGLLFHYFGSKRALYLSCVDAALTRLTTETPEITDNHFHQIIFSAMDEKIRLCRRFPDEMRLLNMASKEMSTDVLEEKNTLIMKYLSHTKTESAKIMARAVSVLKLKESVNRDKANAALLLYVNAMLQKYLTVYSEKPDGFFENSEEIKKEISDYLDLMLYGMVEER